MNMIIDDVDEQRYRPPTSWAARIRLKRDASESTCFLLLEGLTDKSVYGNFVDPENCEMIVVSDGLNAQQTVISTLQILNEDPDFNGTVGIVDSDFLVLSNVLPSVPNLLRTDGHDLETLIMLSPALEKVLREYGQERKWVPFQETCDIRRTLLSLGLPLGYLRWLNFNRQDLGLDFEGLQFRRFVDVHAWSVNPDAMLTTVKNRSQKHSILNDDLMASMSELEAINADITQICCGHDLVELFTFGLRGALGPRPGTQITVDIIDRALRLAYEYRFFKQSQLYQDIIEWEKVNSRFKVLQREFSATLDDAVTSVEVASTESEPTH